MYSVKPGRGPSLSNAFGALGGALFGVLWTCLAWSMTGRGGFPWSLFPLFGVVITLGCLFQFAYNLYNVGARRRLSTLDVTTDAEEGDPLNDRFGVPPASLEERLREVDALKAKGLLSDAEHAAQRRRILDQI